MYGERLSFPRKEFLSMLRNSPNAESKRITSSCWFFFLVALRCRYQREKQPFSSFFTSWQTICLTTEENPGRPDPGKDAVSRVRNHAIVVLPGFPKEFL
jgi:hypothetical protein